MYNQKQTKLIHVQRWYEYQDVTMLISDGDGEGDSY